jgi:hypothetical protein
MFRFAVKVLSIASALEQCALPAKAFGARQEIEKAR